MKQKDISLIIIVSFISAVLSVFISNMIFSSPKNRQEKVEIIDKITADFPKPDSKYFNDKSINPTVVIPIEPSTNERPFNN